MAYQLWIEMHCLYLKEYSYWLRSCTWMSEALIEMDTEWSIEGEEVQFMF